MPTLADIAYYKFDDGTLTVNMANPTPIGGWVLRCQIAHRFGGTSGAGGNSGQNPGIYTANGASGYGGGQSGITVTNSGAGQFQVSLPESVTSGIDFGNYAFECTRLDSGFRTVLTQGYLILGPSIGI